MKALRRVARRDTLRKDLSEREAGLAEALKLVTAEEAEAALAEANRVDLDARIAEIEARLADATQRTQELYHRAESAKEAVNAVGGDGAVARLEAERRTCLLEIQEKARDYIRTRIGVEAAERALRAYRDEHRSTMMERASEAFRTISRGAYTRLESQLTDQGEVLIGVSAGGRCEDRLADVQGRSLPALSRPPDGGLPGIRRRARPGAVHRGRYP